MKNIVNQSKDIYKPAENAGFDGRMAIALAEIKDGDKVLEIGVGWGGFARNIAKHKHVDLYAVDVSESALANIKECVRESQLADISNAKIKFPDNQFDVVVCLEVFEHLQNPYFALSEIQRVLKPQGKLILSIPNVLGGHLMIYPGFISAKHFAIFLKQNYFKIKKTIMWGTVFNKDNLGEWLAKQAGSKFVAAFIFRLAQLMVKALQFVGKLFCLRLASLAWCYFFICENQKGQMTSPFWVRQLEQTSQAGGSKKGWYDSSFHQRVKSNGRER